MASDCNDRAAKEETRHIRGMGCVCNPFDLAAMGHMTNCPRNGLAQKLADNLQGTCKSIDDGLRDIDREDDELTIDEHRELDGLVFECAECGWWCEAGEANENPDGSGEDLCDDCKGDD